MSLKSHISWVPAIVKAPRTTVSKRTSDSWKRIIVVSNRLPFKIQVEAQSTAIKPSAGGLVTAMSPLMRGSITGKWIGWLGDEIEEGLEEALRTQVDDYEIAAVPLSAEEVEKYYRGYSNQVIAPAFAEEIGMIDRVIADTCWETYKSVQDTFAKSVLTDLRDGDIVWVQDYHLLGVGKSLRLHKKAQS